MLEFVRAGMRAKIILNAYTGNSVLQGSCKGLTQVATIGNINETLEDCGVGDCFYVINCAKLHIIRLCFCNVNWESAMKKLFAALVVSAAFFAPSAFAQFSTSQTPAQLQAAIAAQVAAGKSLADISKAALAAGVSAGSLTTAMLGTGAAGSNVIAAVIGAGGDAASVMDSALAAGVLPSVVRTEAINAGVPLGLVNAQLAKFGNASPFGSSSGATGKSGSSGNTGAGGGKASGS